MNVNSVLILRIYLKDLRWWKHSFSWVWVSCRISWSIKTRLTVVYQEYRIILLLDSIFVFCKNKIKREREREWDHIPQEIIITNMIKTITSFPNFKKVDGYLQDIKNDQVQETLNLRRILQRRSHFHPIKLMIHWGTLKIRNSIRVLLLTARSSHLQNLILASQVALCEKICIWTAEWIKNILQTKRDSNGRNSRFI